MCVCCVNWLLSSLDAQPGFLLTRHIYYCHKVKQMFYTIPIFKIIKNNLSFVVLSECTLVFWLPNLDKLHSLMSMNGKLTAQYCPAIDMQE